MLARFLRRRVSLRFHEERAMQPKFVKCIQVDSECRRLRHTWEQASPTSERGIVVGTTPDHLALEPLTSADGTRSDVAAREMLLSWTHAAIAARLKLVNPILVVLHMSPNMHSACDRLQRLERMLPPEVLC